MSSPLCESLTVPMCESCEREPADPGCEQKVLGYGPALIYYVKLCAYCASLPQTGEPLG